MLANKYKKSKQSEYEHQRELDIKKLQDQNYQLINEIEYYKKEMKLIKENELYMQFQKSEEKQRFEAFLREKESQIPLFNPLGIRLPVTNSILGMPSTLSTLAPLPPLPPPPSVPRSARDRSRDRYRDRSRHRDRSRSRTRYRQ